MAKQLTLTQKAMLDRLTQHGEILWASISGAETRILNSLVDKGLVVQAYNARNSTVYQFDHVIDLKQGFEGIGPGEIVLSPGIAYRPILACKE